MSKSEQPELAAFGGKNAMWFGSERPFWPHGACSSACWHPRCSPARLQAKVRTSCTAQWQNLRQTQGLRKPQLCCRAKPGFLSSPELRGTCSSEHWNKARSRRQRGWGCKLAGRPCEAKLLKGSHRPGQAMLKRLGSPLLLGHRTSRKRHHTHVFLG